MSFTNPIVGGTVLRTSAIQSPNFVENVAGWAIFQNGVAYFTGLAVAGAVILGGSITLTNPADGILCYNGTPAPGNLLISISPNGGTDDFGNTYPAGIYVAAGAGLIDGSTISAGSIVGTALANATITAGQLADNSVTADQIATAAVGASELAAGSVGSTALQAGSVTAGAIAADAVIAGTIAAGALDAIDINTGTLTVQGSEGQILVYNGTAATGTLFVSISPQAGNDAYGNSYPAGIAITNNGTISGADIIMTPSNGAMIGYLS